MGIGYTIIRTACNYVLIYLFFTTDVTDSGTGGRARGRSNHSNNTLWQNLAH